jgi:hypothetical protein
LNPLISASFNGTDEALLNKLRGALYTKILQDLKVQVDIEDIHLQSYIVQNKLSGQVLNHRSGTLSDSIRAIPAVIEGSKVTGHVEGAGGPAFYGRFFEEGGKGPYEIRPVRARCLAWMGDDGAMVFAMRVMHPAIPHLPFMQPSLDENRDRINTNLKQCVINSYNKVMAGK